MDASRNSFVSVSVLRAAAPADEPSAAAALDEFRDLLRIDLSALDPARASLGEVERYVEQCARVLPAVRGLCSRCEPARAFEREAIALAGASLRPALAAVQRAVRGIRGGDAEPRARELARAVEVASRELPPEPARASPWNALVSLLR